MLRIALFMLAATVGVAGAQNAPETATAPAVDPSRNMAATGIAGIVAPGTKAEFVRGGFHGTEGVIRLQDGSALFCEQDENRVWRIDLEGNFQIYLENTNRSIGLAFDRKGRLISTQTRSPRIGVLAPTRVTLADSFGGQTLVRPNDLMVDRKDGIYFSDPIGSPGAANFTAPPPGRKALMLYIQPDGTVVKPTDAITDPHKLTLSPDEKTFYATNGDHIVALDVASPGKLVNPRRFAAITAEALVVDEAGRLYASTEDTIEIMSPSGERLGMIPTPIHIQNFAFTGKDRKTIYAVGKFMGKGNVYRIAMLSAGVKNRQK